MTTIRTSDGLDLNLYHWAAAAPELMTLVLIHGYGEHAGRYAHVAERLGRRGIGVVAADLRGHGRSPGVRGHVSVFSEYHRDAEAILEAARARSGGGPVALFGHSMGGLVVTDWLIAGGGKGVAGVVLSSPYLGLALALNPVKAALGRVMSRIVPTLSLPTGIKGSDVTRDPELARLYETDPLNNKNATARWFTEANAAMETVHARAGELGGPMLLLYAGADRVASADATDAFAAKLRGADVTSERLAGYAHELVNEPPAERERVIERVGTWLLGHSLPRAA